MLVVHGAGQPNAGQNHDPMCFQKGECGLWSGRVENGDRDNDWDLPTKRMLISKAHAALEKGGSLIIYEFLIDDARQTHPPGLLMSLNTLIETRGGFDYRGADCIGWTRDAGFAASRVVPLVGPHSAVIAAK
jgi:hypothetical protein